MEYIEKELCFLNVETQSSEAHDPEYFQMSTYTTGLLCRTYRPQLPIESRQNVEDPLSPSLERGRSCHQ